MVLAARGSKITLNGRGCAFADSVKASSSIGAEGSGLMLNAHWTSAVLMKTELLKKVWRLRDANGEGGNHTHAIAKYCPGHTLDGYK